jgi:hypothetical protein
MKLSSYKLSNLGERRSSGNPFAHLIGSQKAGPRKLPGEDHAELFALDGVYTVVTHVYDLREPLIVEITETCQQLGMTFEVLPESWYVPGRTIALAFRKVAS